jgi:hypothetical protein
MTIATEKLRRSALGDVKNSKARTVKRKAMGGR